MPPATPNPLIGILFKLIAVSLVVVVGAIIKTVPSEYPTSQIVFFRVVFSLPFVMIFVFAQMRFSAPKIWRILTPRRFSLHLRRSIFGMTSMACMFISFRLLPLPIASALKELAPILITLLAAMFLGETIRIFRTIGLFLGIFGVVLVSWQSIQNAQNFSDTSHYLGLLAGLGGAFFMALAQIQIRSMVKIEHPSAVVFWFFIITAFVSILFMPFGWKWPSAEIWLRLFAIGFLGAGTQLLITSAYKFADASTIAPFEYFSIPVSLFLGWVLFREWPSPLAMAGIVFILAGGLIIIYREGQLARKRRHDLQNISRDRIH